MYKLSEQTKKQILADAKRNLLKSGMNSERADKVVSRFKDGIIEAVDEAFENEIDFISTYKG